MAAKKSEIKNKSAFKSHIEENMSALLSDACASIIILKGRSHRFEYMNSEAERLFGGEDSYGRTFAEVMGNSPDLIGSLRMLNSIFSQQRSFEINEHSFTRDWLGQGKRFIKYFKGVIKPAFDIEGHVTGAMLFLVEVTDQVFARSSIEKLGFEDMSLLKNAKDKLSAAVRLREEFLAIASHELKLPLTSMGLQLQLAQRNSCSEEKRQESLRQCELQIERLTNLIDELLDVSKIKHGKLILNRVPISMGSVIERVESRLRPVLAESQCKLELELNESIVGLWDPLRLEQVYENLFSNSMKYAPGSDISIKQKNVDGGIIITFEDNGIGIPKESQAKIFDQFERVHLRDANGLGLGLFIVKEIILAHGGSIDLDGDLGRGTKFTIRLPTTTH